jgi:hypothetical protein
MSHHNKPFYDVDILRAREQEYIQSLLSKYRKLPVTEELRQKIYDDLTEAKFQKKIRIPFKVVLRRDPTGKYPDVIDVILDTKV